MSKWSYEDVQFMGFGGNQLPVDQIEHVKSAMEQRDNPFEAMLYLDREFDQLPFLDSNIDIFMDSGVYEFTISLDQVAFCANDREEFEVVLNPCNGILDAIEHEAHLIT